MRPLDYVPVKLAFFLIVGILLGPYLHLPLWAFFVAILICLGVMGYLHFVKKRTHFLFGGLAALAVLLLGAMALQRSLPQNRPAHYSRYLDGERQTVHLKIREILKPTAYTNRYIAKMAYINGTKTEGIVLLRIQKDSLAQGFGVDQELLALGKVLPIPKPLNPHQFNYAGFMAHQGIYHQISAAPKETVNMPNPSRTLWGVAAKTRNLITQKLMDKGFKDDELGVVKALFLGDRDSISSATYDDYKDAGAVHILALSGLHIGILLVIINFLLGPLARFKNGRKIQLLLSVLFLWGFAFLAGLSPSIIRACTMFSFVAYALYLNRPTGSFNILALSILAILLFIDPHLIFQAGFQMSYAAVFAIVGLYPVFQKLWSPKNRIMRYVWQLFGVSIAAQLGVLPISLFYFHQFPSLFLISNFLLLPFMGILLSLGVLAIALALANVLPDFLATFFKDCIALMNKVVAWVASHETFVFRDISFDAVQVVLFYALVISLGLALARVRFRTVFVFLMAVLGFQLWTYYQQYTASHLTTVMVPHVYRKTLVFNRAGKQLRVMGNATAKETVIRDYAVGERLDSIALLPLQNCYTYGNGILMVIDSTGIYAPVPSLHVLLLSGSPKINLDRVLAHLRPKQVVADGSSYPSYVERWRNTCLQHQIPFHYTGHQGAYVLK